MRWGALPRCCKLVGSVATRRARLQRRGLGSSAPGSVAASPGGRYDAMENRTKAVHWYQAALRSDAYCYEVIAVPCRICTGTGLTLATSFAPGLGSPLQHLNGTGRTPAYICAGTGLIPPASARDRAHPSAHICAGTELTPATSAPGPGVQALDQLVTNHMLSAADEAALVNQATWPTAAP